MKLCLWLIASLRCVVGPTACTAFAPVGSRAVQSSSLYRPAPSLAPLRYINGGDNHDTTGFLSPAKLWQAFDLNHDGCVDANDLEFLLAKAFDINGDGKVDEKDGQLLLSMTAFWWMLMASPAGAKGGGSGIGGGGGGVSSSYYGGSSKPSYEPYRRPNWYKAGKHSNPLDPAACSDLPEEGEMLDVLIDENSGSYLPASVTSVNESQCRFNAEILGDVPFLQSRSRSLRSGRNWENLIAPAYILSIIGYGPTTEFLHEQKMKSFDKKFSDLDEKAKASGWKSPPPAKNGLHVGKTTESDGTEQRVLSYLKFGEDGSIRGRGFDFADGKYKISGRWTANGMVRWEETYKDFTVVVRGRRIQETGTIQCDFESSVGIRGRFSLDRKL
ncbi:MAG: hypothetical protein SGARI_005275 [Bacillariaceae sp.]